MNAILIDFSLLMNDVLLMISLGGVIFSSVFYHGPYCAFRLRPIDNFDASGRLASAFKGVVTYNNIIRPLSTRTVCIFYLSYIRTSCKKFSGSTSGKSTKKLSRSIDVSHLLYNIVDSRAIKLDGIY